MGNACFGSPVTNIFRFLILYNASNSRYDEVASSRSDDGPGRGDGLLVPGRCSVLNVISFLYLLKRFTQFGSNFARSNQGIVCHWILHSLVDNRLEIIVQNAQLAMID